MEEVGVSFEVHHRCEESEGGEMAFISRERKSSGGEDATIPPSFMTYHDEVRTTLGIGGGH